MTSEEQEIKELREMYIRIRECCHKYKERYDGSYAITKEYLDSLLDIIDDYLITYRKETK